MRKHVRNSIITNQEPINPRVSELADGTMFRFVNNPRNGWYMKTSIENKIIYLVTGDVFDNITDHHVVPLKAGQTLVLTQGDAP